MEKETGSWFARAIDGVAEDGSTEVFEVDAELMGAASRRVELKKRILIVRGEDFVVSLGRFAVLVDLKSGWAFQIAGNREVDEGFGEFRMSDDDGEISFMGFAILKLATEHFLGVGIFGEDDGAASVAIETMDKQAVVFEGWLWAIFSFRHAEEPGGFVEDEDVRIFVNHRWARRNGGTSGNAESKVDCIEEFGVRLCDNLTIGSNVTVSNESLESGAIILGMLLDEKMIKAKFLGCTLISREDGVAVDNAREIGLTEFLAGDNHRMAYLK